jgi:phage shock protein C
LYETPAGPTRFVRPRSPRMIAGVCSGLAIHYGWDIVMVRMIFAAIALVTTGWAILFYIAAWIIVPQAPYLVPAPVRVDTGTAA